MPTGDKHQEVQVHEAGRAAAGENLRRAHPLAGDGTFGSFLRLLEAIEPSQASEYVRDPIGRL
ncbi:hypothetical protein [Sphingomonas aerophila]|uniref:Uncharacterized protein n=1 Tax=Sphingomonas aerophila TaxID=1344948 RepID=A0A7W9EXY5_9SPHN|nr:hypothetical protein [Sphingomonas aerophila]MBB5717053.1 hypothetical protein [Sphingomonas aerophila]